MKGKVLVMLTIVFASLLAVGTIGALSDWSFPVPTKVNLIPSPYFAFLDASYKLDAPAYRYSSMDVTVQNLGTEMKNCTVEVSLSHGAIEIASGKTTEYNILGGANQTITVNLTWTSGNLTSVTSGYILIY